MGFDPKFKKGRSSLVFSGFDRRSKMILTGIWPWRGWTPCVFPDLTGIPKCFNRDLTLKTNGEIPSQIFFRFDWRSLIGVQNWNLVSLSSPILCLSLVPRENASALAFFVWPWRWELGYALLSWEIFPVSWMDISFVFYELHCKFLKFLMVMGN